MPEGSRDILSISYHGYHGSLFFLSDTIIVFFNLHSITRFCSFKLSPTHSEAQKSGTLTAILILRSTAPSGRRAVRVAYGPGLLDRASSSGSNFTFSFLSIFLCVLFLSSTFLCSIFCLQLFFCLFLLFFLNFCVKKFSPNFLSHNLLLNFFGS